MRDRSSKMSALESERDIINAAIDLLARREYSRRELLNKLGARVESVLLLEQVLDRLIEQGLQSDQRCAEMLARQRITQGYGEYRVRYDLQQKGIGAELIGQTLDALAVDWFALARGYAEKKFDTGSDVKKAVDFKERARRARHLQGRGFSYDEVKFALDNDCQAES